MKEIGEIVRCAKEIEEMIRPPLKRLQRGIFKRHAKVAMGPSLTTYEPVKIQGSSDKDKEGVGVVRRLIEVVVEVDQITKITQKRVQQ